MQTKNARMLLAALGAAGGMTISAGGQAQKDPGLLFYLSGDKGLAADVAALAKRDERRMFEKVPYVQPGTERGTRGWALGAGFDRGSGFWCRSRRFASRV